MRNRAWLQSLIKASFKNRPLAGRTVLSFTSCYFVFLLHHLYFSSPPLQYPYLPLTLHPVLSLFCQSSVLRPPFICHPRWSSGNIDDVCMLLIASLQDASRITWPIENSRGTGANNYRLTRYRVNTRRIRTHNYQRTFVTPQLCFHNINTFLPWNKFDIHPGLFLRLWACVYVCMHTYDCKSRHTRLDLYT